MLSCMLCVQVKGKNGVKSLEEMGGEIIMEGDGVSAGIRYI